MRNFAIAVGLGTLLALVVADSDSPPAFATALLAQTSSVAPGVQPPVRAELPGQQYTRARYQADLVGVRRFRPAYSFWQHIYTIPDGRIIFGSAEDGRLLASFPTRGNWAREGVWEDAALAGTLDGLTLQSRLNRRRDQVEDLLEAVVGPVVHNRTRGRFLSPHARRYGSFLGEWGRDLRAVRCAGADRAGPGNRGVWPERAGPLQGAGPRVLSVSPPELEPDEPARAERHRGVQPDYAGALLCGVPHDSRHDVRQLHPGAVRTSRGRRQRRAHRHQWRAPWRRRCAGTVPDGLGVRARLTKYLHPALPRAVPHLWSPVVPVCGDGVRQHDQRRAN